VAEAFAVEVDVLVLALDVENAFVELGELVGLVELDESFMLEVLIVIFVVDELDVVVAGCEDVDDFVEVTTANYRSADFSRNNWRRAIKGSGVCDKYEAYVL
jgi:hypothetical protein